ncbi:hypothetical protein TNCV_1044581 [Trichonephila clavipes]|nr:hypothetical protein TNCV_1044581 [Trichonephila clavipes]
MSTEVQAAFRRAFKSICVAITLRYINTLRWLYWKKSHGMRSGNRAGYVTGPPCPILRPGCAVFSQLRTAA